tara:strand:+ start:1018 stop:2190 length:1173 start_codon:yes stop_codon:yes gene_type:complete
MAQVIKRFLVGLGFDTKEFDEGQRDVTAGLGNLKGGVLGVSALMVGAFGAAAASVVNTAGKIDELALKTSNLKTPTQFVYNYGNALKTLGGDADDALSAVSAIEETLNNLRVRGEMGALNDLALAGIDISQLQQAPDAQEFLRQLAEQMPNMSMGQRAVARDALGLSDAALKSLVQGVDQFDASIARAEGLTGNIEGLVDNSRKLNEATSELGLAVEGIRNELADRLLPALSGASSSISKFLIENKDTVTDSIDSSISLGASILKYGPFGPLFNAADGLFDGEPSGQVGPTYQDQDLGGYPNSLMSRYPRLATDGFDASGSVAPQNIRERDREENAEAITRAISRSPMRVDNRIDLSVELDGQAIESKITDVNERQNFDSLEDIRTTTDR